MKLNNLITIIEIIIIVVLSLLIVKNKFMVDAVDENYSVYSSIKPDEYKEKFEVDNFEIYEISYFYDYNTNKSNVIIKIFNTSSKIYSLKGFNILIKDKDDKVVNEFTVDLLADIEPNTFIQYQYEYDGESYSMFDGSIIYTPIYE